MKIFSLDEIRGAIDMDLVFQAMRDGFVALSYGQVSLGAVGHLAFPSVRGDCHIKSAAMTSADVFAVKIATGFAANAERGLPTSNGMMVLFSASTGEPVALLQDEGWLTDLRTAIAGAIAVKTIMPENAGIIGIVGTGVQARWQAKLAVEHTGVKRIKIWGRRGEQAQRLACELSGDGLDVSAVDRLEELVLASDAIITTTPTTTPLIKADMFVRPPRIVAIGADAPGKQEIATDLTAAMDVLIADSIKQCLDHGELARPYAAGRIDATRVHELGSVLANGGSFPSNASVLIDLTGVGVQDLQIANAVWTRLADHRAN